MINKRILVVEDDPSVASLIKKTLDEEQAETSVAMDGNAGWDHISRFSYDLLIFDVMMPGLNGIELCKRTRQQGIQTPILLLTALSTVDNIVTGLDAGADDYLTKPFRIAELCARIRSLLRRQNPAAGTITQTTPKQTTQNQTNSNQASSNQASSNQASSNQSHPQPRESSPNLIRFADLTLNLDEKNARRNNQPIDLTATEFRLLEYLMRNPKKVLSRMDILEQVWGVDFNMNTKVVDVYINYLRKKIDETRAGRLIHTVVGMGYILKEEAA